MFEAKWQKGVHKFVIGAIILGLIVGAAIGALIAL